MGIMAVMTAKDGDVKVQWDPAKEEEVAQARKTFDEMKEKRYAAYKMKAGGDRGEQITKFDPKAKSIVLVPPMVGG